MLNEIQLKYKLFDFMFELLIANGGDGDVAYKGSQWKENADLFEEWLNKFLPGRLERNNSEDYITFHHDQECIYFMDVTHEHVVSTDVIISERV